MSHRRMRSDETSWSKRLWIICDRGRIARALQAIASLLYDAISGQRSASLKRACDSVLRDTRGPKLGTD